MSTPGLSRQVAAKEIEKKERYFCHLNPVSLHHPVSLMSIIRSDPDSHGLPSLVQTARRQGVHPRKFLQTLLTADTATAQAPLYNNSS